jgi:formylglycine-generating enzyme required for sulfatase activity
VLHESTSCRAVSHSVACGLIACMLIQIAGSTTAPIQGAEVLTNSIGMKLVLVPAGEFIMGAEERHSNTLDCFPYVIVIASVLKC